MMAGDDQIIKGFGSGVDDLGGAISDRAMHHIGLTAFHQGMEAEIMIDLPLGLTHHRRLGGNGIVILQHLGDLGVLGPNHMQIGEGGIKALSPMLGGEHGRRITEVGGH